MIHQLIVQPRMGFADVIQMHRGLAAVKGASITPRIGTITVDAYTRVGDLDGARQALDRGDALNGYPIATHDFATTTAMLAAVRDRDFAVQVRHGSARPLTVFQAAAALGLDATEGGPVSYNLPYSRAPLAETVQAWGEAIAFWARHGERTGVETHLESFGGCMLGQLAPPSLLVAIACLEALFSRQRGLVSVSLSLAQGSCDAQDVGALWALARIANRRLDDVAWHVVFYDFMGLFPKTPSGAQALIEAGARIAQWGNAQRLIVKTAADAAGIPTFEQNVQALACCRHAADEAARRGLPSAQFEAEARAWCDAIESEAEQLIEGTLALHADVGQALVAAFAKGLLDVPYCTHPDNANWARTTVDLASGAVLWTDTGTMPVEPRSEHLVTTAAMTAEKFHRVLQYNQARYDLPVAEEA
ncbi:MAG: methylaspartate mutase [Candidatus Competibacterales bacterium]